MCGSSFSSCAHMGGTLGQWCLVTHRLSVAAVPSPLWVLPSTPGLVCSLFLTAASESELALQSLQSPPMPSAASQQAPLPLRIPLNFPAFYWWITGLGRPQTGANPAAAHTSAVQGNRQPNTSWICSNGWTFEMKGRNWSSLEFRYNLISLNNQLDIT